MSKRSWIEDHLASRTALARAPKKRTNIVGKVWNAPNTALGLAFGGAGYVLGQANRLRPTDQPNPGIRFGHNAVEFIHSPLTPAGALTLGNTVSYAGDPYDPNDKVWGNYKSERGHKVQEHERQHTIQGEQLGPLYLPSNIAGGVLGLIRDGDWHGPSNWNERGPNLPEPQPWSPRRR